MLAQKKATSVPEEVPLFSALIIAMMSAERQLHIEKDVGRREECKRPNYEREFMSLEWLFRAMEILLPQGPVAKTFVFGPAKGKSKSLRNRPCFRKVLDRDFDAGK